PTTSGRPWWTVAVLVAAAAAAMLAYLLVPVARRHRYRRHRSAAVQVAGAWRDVLARLRLPRYRHTTGELVVAGSAGLGPAADEPLRRLGELADLVAYSGTTVDPGAGRTAWTLRDQLVRRRRGSAHAHRG